MQACSSAIAVLVLLLTISSAFSQGNATIRGVVRHHGKPVAGVKVVLKRLENLVATTSDANGNYRFDAVDPGDYQILTESQTFVTPGRWAGIESVTTTLKQTQREVNIALELVMAGTVTGVLKDENGKPSALKYVQVDRLDEAEEVITDDSPDRGKYLTDSAGVYRADGLPPGRYRVSAGQGVGTVSPDDEVRNAGRRTFHPSTFLPSEAAVIEVAEGEEVKHVDIRMLPPLKLYSVSGRVVDAATGELVNNVTVMLEALRGESGSQADPNPSYLVGSDGRFSFSQIRPGNYTVYVSSNYSGKSSTSSFTDVLRVVVTDLDIDGVELLFHTGTATLSGEIEVEGMSRDQIAKDVQFAALVSGAHRQDDARLYRAAIEPDGRYQITGLIPGEVSILVLDSKFCPGGLTRLRIEKDGQVVPPRFEIHAGENITGVRVTFACGQGRIQGRVVIGGEQPSDTMRFRVTAVRLNSAREDTSREVESDAHGNFSFENVVQGEYQVRATLVRSGQPVSSSATVEGVAQKVTVANQQTSQVILRLEMGR